MSHCSEKVRFPDERQKARPPKIRRFLNKFRFWCLAEQVLHCHHVLMESYRQGLPVFLL